MEGTLIKILFLDLISESVLHDLPFVHPVFSPVDEVLLGVGKILRLLVDLRLEGAFRIVSLLPLQRPPEIFSILISVLAHFIQLLVSLFSTVGIIVHLLLKIHLRSNQPTLPFPFLGCCH